ncbi:Predicted arabinose efflux permease, MFS family [Nocardiopsis flavescens]|uniref:Predicted arabinose efflux permease, MFS family n=1 Tax=Nocardiopsis flavescens TaxID=758803 RepID=A0A1M6J8H4_9ACTN|nr:MFS transporter [Nocardiopsis flavescens]SHJ42989.1 Predicted arabinose efflux permease, MFS family [Nocardiopsis flavescens]
MAEAARGPGTGPGFRGIWAGSACSNLADGIGFVALPLLAASLTSDPLAVAGLTAVHALTRVAAVLGTGLLVDRADRRRLLVLANLLRAALFAGLAALLALDGLALAALYAASALAGVLELVSDGAAVAVLPRAVPARDLDRANSRIAGTQTVLDGFAGPPLGGLLFGWAAAAPVAAAALAYLGAALGFRAAPGGRRPAPAERPGPLREIGEGLRWTARHPVVRVLVAVSAIASTAYMIPFSYLVLYAREVLGLGPAGYGLLLSCTAAGALAGAWAAPRLAARAGYRRSMAAALLTGAAAFAVVAAAGHPAVVAAALAVYFAHTLVWNVLAVSVRQRAVPAALLGRVGSVTRMAGLLGLALGSVLGGLLAGWLGMSAPFGVAAALFAGAALVVAAAGPAFARWERERAGE